MTEALTDALDVAQDDKPVQEVSNAATSQEASDYINTLVGEGKKYANADELAKAYHHANIHIEELKADLEEYKGGKELLNEVLNEIRNSSTEPTTSTQAVPEAPVETRIPTEDVAKIVDEQFRSREKAEQIKNNVALSKSKLVEAYGSEEQSKAALVKAINGDDSVRQIIDNLSRTNPDMVVKFITGVVPKSTVDVSNTPAVTTQSAPVSHAYEGELTWTKCREIKRDNPRLYQSAEFRRSMEAAAAKASERGVDFFAT
jgi:hypothetical protein